MNHSYLFIQLIYKIFKDTEKVLNLSKMLSIETSVLYLDFVNKKHKKRLLGRLGYRCCFIY